MKRLNVLVTGGVGFIGSHLVEVLKKVGHEVTVLDIAGGELKMSVADPKLTAVLTQLKPEIIFHLAAASSVTSPMEDILKSNIAGTYNLLSAATSAGVNKIIFTSSAAVYGPNLNLPIKETVKPQPVSAYGLSKLTGELYCQQFAQLEPVILRLANVYGTGQNSSAEGGVVAIFINTLLANKTPIVFGDGKQTRDFIFVADVVAAMLAAIDGEQGVYNVSTNRETSVNDLLVAVQKQLGLALVPKHERVRSGDIQASRLDNTLIGRQLNWRPEVIFAEGLTQTINYFKNK